MRGWLVLALFVTLWLPASGTRSGLGLDESPSVYMVSAERCGLYGVTRAQTGFQVQGTRGIVTALHGVLDCTGELSAQCTAGSTLKIVGELQIVAVDVPHDVAILAPATPSDLPTGSDLAPAATPPVSEDKLYALGHAQGAHTQIPWRGMLLSKWAKLKGLVPDGSSYALWSRGSPDVNETVLFINGDLVPGTSGAPVLNDQNQVVGISDGGFAGGTIGLAWAIPLAEVTPVPVATAAATLTPLSKQSTEGLFAAEALPGKSTKLRISFTTDAESFGLAQGVWTDSFDTYTLAVPADLDLANAAVEITGEGGEQLAKGNIVAAGEDKPGLYVIDVPSSGTSTPGPATVVANATPNTSSLASQSYRAFQFKKDGDLWEMIYSPIPALYPSEQPFQVSGYVLDAFRQAPVAGVEVTLRTADNRQEFSRAQTDTAGRFVLNVEHNYDKAEALLLVKANCYYPVTVYYERLSKDSVEAPVALYPSCRATPTASATSPLPTPGAGPETGTPTVTPTATLTPTPTATPTPGPIRINDMAAEPLMVLEGGSSGRDGATLKVTNPNRYGLGVAATFTNRGGWHTAFFENQGPGGNLFLQNQGDDSGAGGGDFITARAKTNRTQFAVHSNGEVASNIGFTTPAGDYAEMLPAVPGLTPGDVLAIGPDGRLVRTTEANQLTVAGVYSTAPGFVGGQPVDGAPAGSIPLAITGVVPVKASAENGPIQPGDLLVAAATPGHAMKAPANPAPGSVIGKALEPLDHGLAIIRMAAKLQ